MTCNVSTSSCKGVPMANIHICSYFHQRMVIHDNLLWEGTAGSQMFKIWPDETLSNETERFTGSTYVKLNYMSQICGIHTYIYIYIV